MKAVLIIIILGTGLFSCLSIDAKHGSESPSKSKTISDTVNFKTDVVPILNTKCSPCHFEGGKMYEKMPFDSDVTILNHQAGILRRLKNEPVGALIRQFIEQRKKIVPLKKREFNVFSFQATTAVKNFEQFS